jgi:hypothetical protein
VNALDELIDRFQVEQGWADDTVLSLLKQFLWDRQDKWQHRSMISDVEATFKKVADTENQ